MSAQLRELREQLSDNEARNSRLEVELGQSRGTGERLQRQLADVEREARNKISQLEEVCGCEGVCM